MCSNFKTQRTWKECVECPTALEYKYKMWYEILQIPETEIFIHL